MHDLSDRQSRPVMRGASTRIRRLINRERDRAHPERLAPEHHRRVAQVQPDGLAERLGYLVKRSA
jgi:hypothetical protein